ncbi:replication protein [Thiothrix subterranea]|uniref:Replication protein n=1 Tax=Thiothrix subterranea TaxID=2735563 RepID=A0AA51MKQ6_9GAMM|nr:replication protein [Thiothrix subterranea]MDQ5768653.1 replication protein [Thiothrix subterranea]WML84806.1 replication protein [Thiothrix subterranea]
MNSLVTILDAALAADLGKRQWAMFVAVLRQTLGYRKVSDDLSSGRLSQLTGIQRNHIWQAKQELVDMGLLVSVPGKFGEVLGFAVLHEKLSGVSATHSGLPVRPVPSATDSGLPDRVVQEVLHEKLTPAVTTAIPPDLGVPASQFRPETVPKQDTSLSNHTQSNHNNSKPPLPAVSGILLGEAGIGLSATDSGLCRPSVFSCRSSATDSGCARLPALAGELEWPAGLDAGMRQDMAGLLCGLAVQTAQSVLDVLAMGLEAGKVRKPLAYLRVLVRSAHNGELVVAEAQAWREKRSRERAIQVPTSVFERAGELAWIQQLADLQGLPVDVVASQLGVKVRHPTGSHWQSQGG